MIKNYTSFWDFVPFFFASESIVTKVQPLNNLASFFTLIRKEVHIIYYLIIICLSPVVPEVSCIPICYKRDGLFSI